MTTPSAIQSPFTQFQNLLREMFQFDGNDLDFGLFKILRLKHTFIDQFIRGDGEQDLSRIVRRELAAIRGADDADERQWLANRCKRLGPKPEAAWDAVAANPKNGALHEKLSNAIRVAELDEQVENTLDRLTRWLQAQAYSVDDLEARLYNNLLNFFELYYQNGDFGYNSRATNAFKVPYEADYDGSDTLFHWKHKDCYYIKTGNSFPEVRATILDRPVIFRLQAGGDAETAAQNNNKESDVKHYRLAGIEEKDGECLVNFQLAREGTPKSEIYPALFALLAPQQDIAPYLFGKDDAPIFKEPGKDYAKAEGGQVKGINQLRLSEDNYFDAIARHDAFKALGRNAETRAEALKADRLAAALFETDKKLNLFYVGQDADYFIHKDLRAFLGREKDRFIKNVIFSDLDALLDLRGDAATRVIARAFNGVATRIIDFLDATETFQRNLFTLKKKVIDTHWLISVGKIPESYWPRLLQNPRLIDYFQREFKQTVTSVDDLKARPTLVVDTSLFVTDEEKALIDEILSDPAFDHLDAQTDGLLIHSENWQALNLLQEKFRERIKCIYIDPPYNTGGDGFLYKDAFRHSSWAAMMAQGLELANTLLVQDGLMFASIDENEKETLKLISGHVFPESYVSEIIRTTGTPTAQGTTGLSNTFDSVLLLGKKERVSLCGLPLTEEDKKIYNQKDDHGRYLTRSLRMTGEEDRREDRPDMYYGVDSPDGVAVFPVGPSGYESRWRLKKDEYLKRVEEGRIEWKYTTEMDDSDEDDGGQDESTETWKPYLKFYMPETRTVQNLWDDIEGNKKGKRDLKNVVGSVKRLTPKPVGLIQRIVEVSSSPGDFVLDFFSGTGTTACAVIATNEASKEFNKRKWMLCEFGEVFNLAKSRVVRSSFCGKWRSETPLDIGSERLLTVVKAIRLEQYEDTLANLETAWDAPQLPEGVPVRYLFRPEENRVRQSLDLTRPFANTLRVGRNGEPRTIDLLETWALLQGYWVRSRRVFVEAGRRYVALETECACLVLLRDINEPEDDSAALNAIAARYVNADGSPRIQRLEVNHWADLRKVKLPCTLISPVDFDRGAAWN